MSVGRLTAPVITVLEPHERSRVDAAGAGLYRAIHRESVGDALEDLKRRRVSAVLVSVTRCGSQLDRRMATMVREYPSVPTVALLGPEPTRAESLLNLGNAGITRLVDVRGPMGWHRLREILRSEAQREADRVALAVVIRELGEVSADCATFFEALFTAAEGTRTIRDLALHLGVLPSTLMSRFFRAGLPSPKRFLAFARLLRAARLFEDAGHSVADVANALDYSSAQSLGRHIRSLLGVTATDFRREYRPPRLLERLLDDLVRPYRNRYSQLRPLAMRTGMRPPPSTAVRAPAHFTRKA